MVSSDEIRECGGKTPFPHKLFQMLHDADDEGFRHIVSWNTNGRAFKVHDSVAFTKMIVPKYFKQTRYKSFQRQLCLYGFDRVLVGNIKGSRYHKKFVRGNFKLCKEIKYIGIKSKMLPQTSDASRDIFAMSTHKLPTFSTTQSLIFQKSPSSATEKGVKSNRSFCSSPTTQSSVSQIFVKHIVSPTISPLSSAQDLSVISELSTSRPAFPDSDDEALEAFCSFEGMAFHFIDATRKFKQLRTKAGTQDLIPERKFDLAPSSGDEAFHDDGIFSEQMTQAWQKGFEMALSMPSELYASCMSSSLDRL